MTDLIHTRDGAVPLGQSTRVAPREIRLGQYVHRARPDGSHAGWYKVLDVVWQPEHYWYEVRIERPETLRGLMADRYHLTYGAREAVRNPITETEAAAR